MTDVGFGLPGIATSTSWEPPTDFDFEQWKSVGEMLGSVERSVMWWIGDWWAFGQHHYGERAAIVKTPDWDGPSFQTCMNAASVCRRFETSRRREALSYSHHVEVAAIAPETADWLLDQAMPKEDSDVPELSVRRLRGQIKGIRRIKREFDLAEAIEQASVTLHGKRYGVIYADPPWRFEPWSRETGMDRAADNHYPTMSLENIRDLAVPAADDCVCFLWATAPMLAKALRLVLVDGWGFDYVSCFIWKKDRMGTGYWFRNEHELLLVGVKGDVPAPSPETLWSSVIEAPVTSHSVKPELFAEMIETYFPKLPKIELFRRGASRDGWDAWGAEARAAE